MKTARTIATAATFGALLVPAIASAGPTCGPDSVPCPTPAPTVHATGTANGAGKDLSVFNAPTTRTSVARRIKTGSKVLIVCQTRGQSVYGPFGRSTTWDKLKNGGYVSDAFVYTGSDGRVAPDCKDKPYG